MVLKTTKTMCSFELSATANHNMTHGEKLNLLCATLLKTASGFLVACRTTGGQVGLGKAQVIGCILLSLFPLNFLCSLI